MPSTGAVGLTGRRPVPCSPGESPSTEMSTHPARTAMVMKRAAVVDEDRRVGGGQG